MIIEAPCKICNKRHTHCRERIKANQQASDAIAVKERAVKKRQGWIR